MDKNRLQQLAGIQPEQLSEGTVDYFYANVQVMKQILKKFGKAVPTENGKLFIAWSKLVSASEKAGENNPILDLYNQKMRKYATPSASEQTE